MPAKVYNFLDFAKKEDASTASSSVQIEPEKFLSERPIDRPSESEGMRGVRIRSADEEFEIPNVRTPAESLYRVETGEENLILKVIEIVNEGLKCLDVALENFDQELERETQMDIFQHLTFELSFLSRIDTNFGDVITALQVALKNKNNTPYTREEIIGLRYLMNILRDNIIMSERSFVKCLSILDDNFNTVIPIEVDL